MNERGVSAPIALATARRACSSRFSSLFAALPASLSGSRRDPAGGRRRGRGAPPRSRRVARRFPRSDHPPRFSSSTSASRSAGWRTSRPAWRRCNMQPGLAETTTAPVARSSERVAPCGPGWRSRARAGARRTRRPRRSTVRRRRSRRARTRGRARFAPRRAPAARGADDTGPARRPWSPVARTAGSPSSATHSEKSRTARAERFGVGSAEQPAVVLHDRAAARTVDHHRRGRRASTR